MTRPVYQVHLYSTRLEDLTAVTRNGRVIRKFTHQQDAIDFVDRLKWKARNKRRRK